MITLKDAIYLEKIDEVKRILEENPPLIDEVDEDGNGTAGSQNRQSESGTLHR